MPTVNPKEAPAGYIAIPGLCNDCAFQGRPSICSRTPCMPLERKDRCHAAFERIVQPTTKKKSRKKTYTMEMRRFDAIRLNLMILAENCDKAILQDIIKHLQGDL